jgi:hypothetical protein
MSKIYTKNGDGGFSSINNNKLPKYSEYFHTLGYLDEVNSQIGWFLSLIEKTDNTYSQLIAIQNNLMTISSYLCGYIKDVSYLELDLTNLEAQIDIIDGVNVLLYLHNCEYNQDLIQCAIDVIDHLTLLLKDINNKSDNTCNISNEILTTINMEYTQFINKKLSLKNYINDCTKKMNAQISELELPTLSLLLKQKYSTVIVTDLTCKHCEKYVGINKKSLSVHYRNCVKTKINNNTDNESSDNTESPNIETPIIEPPKVTMKNKKNK